MDRKKSPLSSMGESVDTAGSFWSAENMPPPAPGIKVQVETPDSDADKPRYKNVATVEMPQVPRTGDWIYLKGLSWRVMRVEWYPPNPDERLPVLREGGAMLLVRPEPLYDFPTTPPEGVDDPWAPENGVLGGRPDHI